MVLLIVFKNPENIKLPGFVLCSQKEKTLESYYSFLQKGASSLSFERA